MIKEGNMKRMRNRFSQVINPRTKKYSKIDRKTGIISHKSTPYRNVPIIELPDNKTTKKFPG